MRRLLKKFRKDDSGHASIEFVIMFPLFFWIMVSAIDIGMITMRSAFLERSLDVVVRDIRLSTGTAPDHDEIRRRICEANEVVKNCTENLMLEMQIVDMRAWNDLPQATSCTPFSSASLRIGSMISGFTRSLTAFPQITTLNSPKCSPSISARSPAANEMAFSCCKLRLSTK